MIKNIIQVLFAFLLAFSILAPSIWSMCVQDEASIVWSDSSSDEEKQEKQEKELEEKILQWDIFETNISFYTYKKENNNHYQERYLAFSQAIILPPPEHIN